jgi:tRNA(fMet)-specific endonuclease VapC
VSFLLDTNACIALINEIGRGRPSSVRLRLERVVGSGTEVHIPSVVAFELWYGVARSARPEANAKRVETFLAGPMTLLPFDEEDAKAAGRIRAAIEAAGKPIGPYDVLIAGQALRRQLTLVTANVREFARIKGLLWEDWAKS